MVKPSGILTMTLPSGKTHLEREEDYSLERQRRLMEFMVSPVVKEIMEQVGRDLIAEYNRQSKAIEEALK